MSGFYRCPEDAPADVNSPIGLPVQAIDPDVGYGVRYAIESSDPPAFGVNAITGALFVRAAVLDYEQQPVATIVVRATEYGQPLGLYALKTIIVSILNVNDIMVGTWVGACFF